MERPPPLDIGALLKNGFDETTARSLYAQGEEIVIFALLQLSALALTSPNINGEYPCTPSATVAAFQKENKQKGKHKKKPGVNPGHKGSRRAPPVITQKLDHRATHCPDCGTQLNKRNQTRKRLTEDIPATITPEVTEHTVHRDYCARCDAECNHWTSHRCFDRLFALFCWDNDFADCRDIQHAVLFQVNAGRINPDGA